MKLRMSKLFLAGLAAVAWSTPAGAQIIEQGRFDVNVGGGAILHPNHSALVGVSPVVNLQGRMFVSENFGVGFSLDYARTETDDDIFPLAQFRFPTADSTLLIAMKQPVAAFNYQLIGTFGASVGERIYPYLIGGIGGYTLYLDPQVAEGAERHSDLAFTLGGAIKLGLSGSSAIELSVRDVVFTGYERDVLNPVPDRTCRESGEQQFSGNVCPNERFPFLDPERSDPNWSEANETVHNIVFSAAFSFFPRL